MKVESACPDCESKLGLQIEHSLSSLIANKIEDMLEEDDNRVYCPVCEDWTSPNHAEQVE